MTLERPAFCDDVQVDVDLIEINRFFMIVRNRASGREHSIDHHLVLIGSSDAGDCYTLTVPAWLAQMEGLSDAR